jgi:glycosyltransferase involved in cell wall biosynthesis
MRVLHVVPALFGERGGIVGGAERYAWELARHMARSVETTLLSFGSEDRAENVDSLRVRVLGKPWNVRGSSTNPVSLRAFPELLQANVVHCHQQHVLMSSLLAIFGRLTGRRVFATDLGGGGFDLSGFMNTDPLFRGHLHISEYSRKVFGHGANPTARVILTGVDAGKFSPAPDVPRTGGGLFVGRLLSHKGIDRVLEVLPPEIPFEIIGRPYDSKYLELLRQLAVGKQVTFHLDFDDVALVEAYRRSRFVVLPSLYKDRYGSITKVPELMGQTLLEGMATGLPAICTDVASMPEAVEHGVTGFVVAPDDPDAMRNAMTTLYNDPALASRMGAAGRERMLTRFSWDAVVKRCLEAYCE